MARLPTGLIEFDCSFSYITGGLIDDTFEGLNQLNFALLDGNSFNSTVPAVFGRLPNLQFLYLSEASIEGDLSYMEGMPAIVEHFVNRNPRLTGPVYPFIGDISTLASFSASQNSLTGTLSSRLGNLSQMIQMWLFDNQLIGNVPTELGRLASMSLLQLEGNHFTGSMPTEVCANVGFLRPLTTLGADCNDRDFTVRMCEYVCCVVATYNRLLRSRNELKLV